MCIWLKPEYQEVQTLWIAIWKVEWSASIQFPHPYMKLANLVLIFIKTVQFGHVVPTFINAMGKEMYGQNTRPNLCILTTYFLALLASPLPGSSICNHVWTAAKYSWILLAFAEGCCTLMSDHQCHLPVYNVISWAFNKSVHISDFKCL